MRDDNTISLELPSYLKNYLLKLYGPQEPIRFKQRSLYNRLLLKYAGSWPTVMTRYHLMRKNELKIFMPASPGRHPKRYSYLSKDDACFIRSEISMDFMSDYISFVKHKMRKGLLRSEATILFMETYNISDSDLSYDAFYRYFSRREKKRKPYACK